MAFRMGADLADQTGISITQSLQYTFIIAIAAPFGPLLASALGDKVERKWLIVGAAFAIAMFGLLFGQTTAAVPLIGLGVLLTLSNNVLSFSFHSYPGRTLSDANPSHGGRIRLFLESVCPAFSAPLRICFFSAMVWRLRVFTLIAGSMLIVMLSIGLLGPRTSNLSLDCDLEIEIGLRDCRLECI